MGDTEPITSEVPTEVIDREQEKLRKNYVQEAKLGRRWHALMINRDDQRLWACLDRSKIPRELWANLTNREGAENYQITAEDVKKARKASLAVGLEAAAQITEARIPSGGQVRENPDSLETVRDLLRRTHQLKEEYLTIDPTVLADVTRGLLERRKQLPRSGAVESDQAAAEIANSILTRAGSKIARTSEALKSYTGR